MATGRLVGTWACRHVETWTCESLAGSSTVRSWPVLHVDTPTLRRVDRRPAARRVRRIADRHHSREPERPYTSTGVLVDVLNGGCVGRRERRKERDGPNADPRRHADMSTARHEDGWSDHPGQLTPTREPLHTWARLPVDKSDGGRAGTWTGQSMCGVTSFRLHDRPGGARRSTCTHDNSST
jgi:hypothetical protein